MILHETCLEYFRRRLSEGWKCISLEGYNAALLSTDGMRRELDLRNDIDTLRPSSAGDETNLNIAGDVPAPTNWQSVDEAIADDDTTYVEGITADNYDLYNLPAHSGSGTINFIKVYIRCQREPGITGVARIKIKTNGTEYDNGSDLDLPDSWTLYSHQWNTNPSNVQAWTWDEIDALQIGVFMKYLRGMINGFCTQVYVEVDYTPTAAFEYVGTGTFTYSGTAVTIIGFTCAGSGELAYSGTAIQIYTRDYLTTASGQLTYSGSAEQVYSKNYLFEGSGELTFSGTAIITIGLAYIGSGVFTYSGKAFHRWGDWAPVDKEETDFTKVDKKTSDWSKVEKGESNWDKTRKE